MKIPFAILTATSIALGICSSGKLSPTLSPIRPDGDSQKTSNNIEAVDFKNDLIPMFTKLGCNAGKCHGSAIGRGDFKLSLYGGNPRSDYDEIVHQLGGRRVNLKSPSSSLVFQKPAEHVEHGGGTLLSDDDPYADQLLDWIRQGAPYVEHRQLKEIVVTPSRWVADARGDTTSLQVMARYDDGQVKDVTQLTQFVAEDPTAILVDSEKATAQTIRNGRHLVIARYATEVVPIEILVPVTESAPKRTAGSHQNFVDDQVTRTLSELRLPTSSDVDESRFLRRITLDLTGRLPKPPALGEGVRKSRESVVDELLASDEFIEFYTLKLAKLFRIQSKIDKNKVTTTPAAAEAFHNWLAAQLRKGAGYDELARTILTATGDSSQYGPATFYTAAEDPRLQTEFVTEVFMGSRMKCANCHNHPLDLWTQDDFHGLTAMFAKLTRSEVIRINPIGKNIHPNTGAAAKMKIPGGATLPEDTTDGRHAFADWLTARENPYFAKAIVNRLWKSLMGRGLVEPVDDFRSTNPATHPDLLDLLAADFVQHGYDLRHTLKRIALSSTYGRSSEPVTGNETDQRFYSHMIRKSLAPEVLADAISDVLGVASQYGDEILGTRAVQLHDGAIRSDALDILGRCNRTNSCEGAPSPTGPLAQKLHLFNGELLNGRINAPGSRLDKLIRAGRKPSEIVEEFYQVALNRPPSEEEMETISRWLNEQQPASAQRETLEDFVWSIVTCQEFVSNH